MPRVSVLEDTVYRLRRIGAFVNLSDILCLEPRPLKPLLCVLFLVLAVPGREG